jgi:transcriptional regulator with XRE-family HTH domain
MRKSRGMTQYELAESIGQSASSITMYENGRREPNFETLEAIADAFNVSLFEFIPVADNPFDYVDDWLDEMPKTHESRVLAKGIDKMPEALRKAIMTTLAYQYPSFFEEGNEDDDT